MTDPRPLWEVMYHSFWKCPTENWRLSSAYMIRAVRDWLVPEEGSVIPDGDLTEQAYRSDERAGLRAILTAEADRAERGDHDAVALAMEGGWISPEFIPYEARKAAAILRAAANQIGMNQPLGETDADAGVFAAHNAIKHWLLAIVAELEAR